MSFMNSYLNVLNEDNKDYTSKGVATDKIVGELDGAEKAKTFAKDSGPEAQTVEAPVKGPHSENDEESLPSPVKKESNNPFDVLYNKFISEEALDGDLNDNFEGDEDGGSFDFETTPEEEGEDEEMSEEEEEVSLNTVLDHLKSAVEALEKLAAHESGESSEEEMGEDEFDTEEVGDETPVSEEGVEIEELKSTEDLTDKSKQAVKGAVPVTKKKGEVTKGVKTTGKLEKLSGNPEELTSKNKQNVGGVTAGKFLFDQ